VRKKYVGWVSTFLTLGVLGAGTKIYLAHKRCPTTPVDIYALRLPSGAIFLSEDPHNPRLQNYMHHEHLDEVVRPYKTDFEKILALAQWTSVQFQPTSPFPHYPPWDGQVILDRIRGGKTGGFCAQYAFVFGQACQSVGFIPRYLDLAAPENLGGHFTTEVYVPSLHKWVVFEPEWGMYYTDQAGHPLSAIELHEWAIGRRKDPYIEMPKTAHKDTSWIHLFYYFRYYLRNNFLTVPVYVRGDGGQMGFEPYRMIWNDPSLSIDPKFLSDAIPSADAKDFQFPIHAESIPEFTWKKPGDFYKVMASQPVYQLCKIHIPQNRLVRLIKKDFINNPAYHRLKS
jgi:hypothetical protein